MHKFVCRGSVEERIEDLLASKRELSEAVLAAGGDEIDLSGMSDEALLRLVALDLNAATRE